MATLDTRVYSANFSGLTSTAVTCIAFLAAGATIEGVLKRLRRYPDEDARRKRGEPIPELHGRHDRGMEDWAMGYLYRARSFVPHEPTRDYSTIPFRWIWESIRRRQRFFEEHTGEDATVYVRFIRACSWWTVLMAFTLFPVIIGVNFVFSARTYSAASIERASTAALVNTPSETGRLWVHTVCIWFASVTWYLAISWVGYGAVRARRNVVRKLVKRNVPQNEAAFWLSKTTKDGVRATNDYDDEPYGCVPGGKGSGWQQRTVFVRNIPESMRSESALEAYFARYLRPEEQVDGEAKAPEAKFVKRHIARQVRTQPPAAPKHDRAEKMIADIILVRKHGELTNLYIKYKEQLGLLEEAHGQLASNVRDHVALLARRRSGKPEKRTLLQRLRIGRRKEPTVDPSAQQDDEVLYKRCIPFVDPSNRNSTNEKSNESFWTVLDKLEPRLLDQFQPLIKLKHFQAKVPAIDYHLAKLNLLATLLEEKREQATKVEPTGSAFVTFTSVDDAIFVRRYLKSRPGGLKYAGRAFECLVTPAPEVRDLYWHKLVKVSLTSDLVRGLILQTSIWVVTLIWVIPLSFVVGLLSLNQIQNYLPGVANWIRRNPVLLSVFSNLLPSAIVSLISMFVPTVIGILTRSGQTFITETTWQLATQARYWKWLMINVVIIFSIGQAAFTAFLNAFKSPASVLTVIATSMPKAATFFCSWALLVIGIHHGIQHCLFGIPFINHASIRKMRAPRRREFEAQPRFFSYHYWVPNHLLVLAVTILFAILNPLVIPFSMVYFAVATVVFKNQLAHVYWRRQFENGGKLVFRRVFRYSLDAFLVAQVVAMAFMWVQKIYRFGAAIIPLLPITVVIKLLGTRYFDRLMAEIDDAEARVLCGLALSPESTSVEIVPPDDDWHRMPWRYHLAALSDFFIKTIPALIFKPHSPLPLVRTASKLAWHAKEKVELVQSESVQNGTVKRQNSTGSSSLASADAERSMTVRSEGSSEDIPTTLHRPAADSGVIVRSRPPVLRDDRPVTNAAYDNPALVAPLANCLWLPRDPLKPIDLADTVDYFGRILVSSEGSEGKLGKMETVPDFEAEKEKIAMMQEGLTSADDAALLARITSGTSQDGDRLERPAVRRDDSHQSGVSITVTPAAPAPIDVEAANKGSTSASPSPQAPSHAASPSSPSRLAQVSSRLSSFSAEGRRRSESFNQKRRSISHALAVQNEIVREQLEEMDRSKEEAERERRDSTNWFKRVVLRSFEDETEN